MDDPDEGYEAEIAASHGRGSYNFPWAANGRRGIATARFRGDGDHLQVDVIAVHDRLGRKFAPDDAALADIRQQALDFIDRA